MGARIGTPINGLRRGETILTCRILTTTSGTISTATTAKYCGMTVAKTGSETGRYTFTLQDKRLRVLNLLAVRVIGPDDTAMTDAKGIIGVLRDLDAGVDGAADGTFDVQLCRNTDLADTEVQDSATIIVSVLVGTGAAEAMA